MLIDDINKNRALGLTVASNRQYKILVLGNIIINQIKDLVEIPLRENNINAQVTFADYDNFVQASAQTADYNAIIIFWEACNLIKGIHYKSNLWSIDEINVFTDKVKSEINVTLNNLQNAPLVIFNTFDNTIFNAANTINNNLDLISENLNEHLLQVKNRNVHYININKIIAQLGIQNVFNKRMWNSSSMLYTYDFLKYYASKVAPYILSIGGKAKKVMVLDCDNTLWKGIVGEDGPDGIAYNNEVKDGEYFEEVHYILKNLSNKGILLALNSKNNEQDVRAIFTNNPNMLLKWDDFIITKVNWNDKVSNLKAIAKELNVGIDSLVHMDDSNFEINHIQQELPEVKTIQVPESLKDYANILKENLDLFLNLNRTAEDEKRTAMYHVEKIRQDAQNNFSNIDEYLQSLELELNIVLNDKSAVDRIAQMTQKTNQFNLTTPRYTESEIEQFMNDKNYRVFSFGLKDKFGDYGITGLCILNAESSEIVNIDTLLMSCRIIGRNAEFAFLNFIVDDLRNNHFKTIKAKYIKTFKNAQVENLFDTFGMQNVSNQNDQTDYIYHLINAKTKEINYIKINYER